MATGDLLIRKPWNIDVDVKKSQGDDINKAFNITTPSAPVSSDGNISSKDIYNKIFQDAFKSKSQVNLYASKFQDAGVSSRYEGRNVYYQDYLLDPSKLDHRYAHTQSWGETAMNNLKVGLANGASMFAIGTLALPEIIKNIATGRSLSDSDLTQSMFEWSEGVRNNNINFRNEQDDKKDAWNTIANTILPSFVTGSTTGWGSVFENMMYGVGAGLSAYVTGGIAGAALRGISSSALLSTQVAKTLNNLDSLRKYGTFAERIIDGSKAIRNTATILNNSYKLTDAAKWSYRGLIGSFGEAGFEGEEARHSTKQLLTERYKQMHGFDPMGDDLVQINKLSDEAASARFWSNMALLMATNTYQMGRLFKNVDIARDEIKRLAEQGIKLGIKEDGEIIAKKSFELTGNWWNTSKLGKSLKKPVEMVGSKMSSDFVKESISEGLEEFSQNWIDKSVNSYYTWKLDHRGQPAIDQALKSIRDGFSESWNIEGLQAFLSGAIAGVGQQAIFSLPNISKQRELSKQNEDAIKEVLSDYNIGFDVTDFFKASNVDSLRGTAGDKASELNAEGVIDATSNIATKNEDIKTYKDLQTLSFFNMAEPYIRRGHADILKEKYAFSIENLSEEAFQELNNNSGLSKQEAVNIFNSQVDGMNASFSRIKQAFRNPYSYNVDPNKYSVFESLFIPELSYLDYRTGELNKRLNDIQSTLGEYYDEFKYFSDAKKLNRGKEYIKQQIENYSNNQEYFKKIKMVAGNEEFNKSKYLVQEYTKALSLLEEFENTPDEFETIDDQLVSKRYTKYNEFLNTYFEAFVSKLERDERGFLRKEEVMNKLSDFERIVGDLNEVEDLLKAYMSPKGDEIFTATVNTTAKREQRKRDLYNINQGLINKRPDIIKQFPTLTEEEIDEVLLDSTNSKQVENKLSKLVKQKEKDKEKITAIQDEIRELFVKENFSTEAEDYINNINISPKNKKDAIKNAKDYIQTLKNDEYKKHKENISKKLTEDLNKISPDFNKGDDTTIYNSLGRADKIKYHEALIDYHKGLKDFKGLPNAFVKKQEKLIKEQEDIIKSLPKEEEHYNEQIGDYSIVKDNKGKYNVSYKNKYAQSFDSEREAKDYIQQQEDEKNIKKDVSSGNHISRLENKFENGYYNPERFDDKNQVIQDNLDNKVEWRKILIRKWEGLSEDQINDKIKENAVFTRFTTEGVEGTTKLYSSDDENSGNLYHEVILKGMTADAVVLSYVDGNITIPLNTYKHPKKSIAFMNDDFIREALSKTDRAKFSAKEINDVIKFVKGHTYYSFLQKSLTNPSIYNLLVGKNILRFKGTIQDQITLIEQKQEIFDRLMNEEIESIKENFDFTRVFTSINTSKSGTHSINSIEQPFAQVKGDDGKLYNNYVFFHVPNTFEAGGDPKVDFVDLGSVFQKDAKEKITRYFNNGNRTVSSGYHMLLTDSVGNPIVYPLKNKQMSAEDVFASIVDTPSFKGVYILSSNPNYDITVSEKTEGYNINIGDKSDNTLLVIQNYKIESVKDAENLIDRIYKELNSVQNWVSKTDGKQISKSIDTSNLGISYTVNTSGKPSNNEDIINSRDVTGINPHNFMVNKIILTPKQIGGDIKGIPVEKKEAPKVVEVQIESSIPNEKSDSRAMAKRFDIDVPPTITFEQIDDLIGKIPNLQSVENTTKAVLMTIGIRANVESSPIYLNNIEDVNIEKLEKLSSWDIIKMNQTIRAKDFANLINTQIPYKTNIIDNNTETEIQKLLKNCFR